MKKILFLATVLSIFASSFGQNPSFRWARQCGGPLVQEGISVTIDASENVYSAGRFKGTVDFDPGPGVFNLTSAGEYDTYIIKLDSAGNFIWAKSYGSVFDDKPTAIMTHSNNGLIISGTFSTTVDFDPGAGTYNLLAKGEEDGYLLKLDLNGNFGWIKQIGSVGYDACNALTADANSNIYVVGDFSDTLDFDSGPATVTLTSDDPHPYEDIFLLKLDAAGNFLMVRQMGGWSYDYGTAVTLDASNNIYVGGTFSYEADLDPGPALYTVTAGPGGYDGACVIKLGPAGNFLWGKNIGGGTFGTETLTSMKTDQNNDIYIVGNFYGNSDFDTGPGTYSLASAGLWDMYMLKLTAGGTFVAVHSWGSVSNEFVKSINIDCSGNKFLGGRYNDTVDFDSGTGTNNMYSYYFSGFILKMDAADNFTWVKDLGYSSGSLTITSSDTQINDCALSKVDGSIYSTGAFYDTTDMDPGTGTYTLASMGANDIFLHKLMQCVTPPTPNIIGGTNLCSGSLLTASGCGNMKWYTSATNTTAIATGSSLATAPLAPGNYTYFIQAEGGCNLSSSKSPVSFTVNSRPTISVTGPASACVGDTVSFSASGTTSYTWNTSSQLSSITVVVPPGTFSVVGTGTNGCRDSVTKTMVLFPTPTVVISASPQKICTGQSATISASGANTYSWNTSSTNTALIVSPGSSTLYLCTGTTSNSCKSQSSYSLAVYECVGLTAEYEEKQFVIYPNPTDGSFIFKGPAEEAQKHFMLSNSLGQVVYRGSSYMNCDISWLPPGIYYLSLTNMPERSIKIVKY